MPRIEYSSANRTVEIDFDHENQETSTQVFRFNLVLDKLHLAAPLTSFSVLRDLVNPTKFAYSFVAADGRLWQQTIFVPSDGSEAIMDFSFLGHYWRESEFSAHRRVREEVIEMIRKMQLSKIDATWS